MFTPESSHYTQSGSRSVPVPVITGMKAVDAGRILGSPNARLKFVLILSHNNTLFSWGCDSGSPLQMIPGCSDKVWNEPQALATGIKTVVHNGANIYLVTRDDTLYGSGRNLSCQLGTGGVNGENELRHFLKVKNGVRSVAILQATVYFVTLGCELYGMGDNSHKQVHSPPGRRFNKSFCLPQLITTGVKLVSSSGQLSYWLK